MREAVSNTTLNNNTRSTPTIPWLFLQVCLLLLLVLSRNICRAAKQNTFATGRPAHAGRGKALFSHHSLPSGSVLSRPTPRSNHRPPPSSSHLSIATPLLLLLRLPFASRAVQNPPSLSATGAVSVAYHPHQLAVRGSVREKKPASHFRASKHPPSEQSSACPLSLPPFPCATEAEGFAQKDGANPSLWCETTRRPIRSHGYILVPHWRAHCLGSPAFGASLLGPSAPWVHTSVVNLAVSPPPGPKRRTLRRLVF